MQKKNENERKKTIAAWIIHPLIVIFSSLLSFLLFYDPAHSNTQSAITISITSVVEFYVVYIFIVPLLFHSSALKFLIVLLIYVIISGIINFFLYQHFIYAPTFSLYNIAMSTMIGLIILIRLTIFFAAWGNYTVISNFQLSIENSKNQLNTHNAELIALRMQMNPHFLFNALRNVSYLIRTHENDKALIYNAEIAQLLNRQLEFGERNYISLEEELKWLENYLAIERNRLSGSFNYVIKVQNSALLFRDIPPMLLQPLVENSLVHGFALREDKKGLLRILITEVTPVTTMIVLEDNGSGNIIKEKSKRKRISIAIDNIEKRIILINATEKFDISFNKSLSLNGMRSVLIIKELEY
jgi:sensor histidine kinase YesM